MKIPDKLIDAWNENPLTVIGVGAAAVAALSKLIESVSSAKSRRAYVKQVNYRVKSKK